MTITTRKAGIYRRILDGDFEGLHHVDEETGCWLWLGRTNDKGYGLLDVPDPERPGRTVERKAHRVYFETLVGPIPSYLDGMHLCDTTRCCNPACIALGTNLANQRDRARRRRGTGRYAGVAA